ncbi:uncharacterized protein LOC144443509 [Glandiceps talaboti]
MANLSSGMIIFIVLASSISADKTIKCPSCWHLATDADNLVANSLNDNLKNEACIAEDFNPSDPNIETTTCVATGTEVPKCVKFSGQIDAGFFGTFETHMRSCTVESSNPGNICEDVHGDDDSNSFLAEQISKVLATVNFLGDDTFTGKLCYSDDSTSKAGFISATQIVVWVQLALMLYFAAL